MKFGNKFVDHGYFKYFRTQESKSYPKLSDNAEKLLNARYYMETYDENNKLIHKEKSFSELSCRVARCLASAEVIYTSDLDRIKLIEFNIYEDLMNHRFMFNSPAIFNLGKGICNDYRKPEMMTLVYKDIDEMTLEDYKTIYNEKNPRQMCFACFVLGIDDSLDSIMDSMKNAAVISKAGGGVGFNFSNTRERGSAVHGGIGGKASGPVSWITMYNGMANAVVQGGQRRAAFMGMLNDNHPDIYEFIHAKDEDGLLDKFNLSVAVSDKLITNAIDNPDTPMEFISRKDNIVTNKVAIDYSNDGNPIYSDKNITCGQLWNDIAEHAWKRGDPGIFFIDRANDDNILKESGDKWFINGTNPCGEQPLYSGTGGGTSCNLGSINVNAFIESVDNKSGTEIGFNIYAFRDQVYRSMYYLDLILDASEFPISEIKLASTAIRPVGLGLMGIGDLAFRLDRSYKSQDFIKVFERISIVMAITSLDATVKMTTEAFKKSFSESHYVKQLFENNGITTDTIANSNLKDVIQKMIDSKIPYTLVNTLVNADVLGSMICYDNEDDITKYTFDLINNVINGNMRNSRRLTIAPTGSTSMMFDASGGIEPLFALSWGRKVYNASNLEKSTTTYDYIYPHLTQEEKNIIDSGNTLVGDKYLCANDLSVEDHILPVSIFARYCDSGISKTINLPSNATVEDVKNAYLLAYKNFCKGITVYRDGSRTSQPIVSKTNTNDTLSNKKKAERPHFANGITENVKTSSLGKLYATVNFDEADNPFEVWLRIGKSGNELTSMVDALARVISIALRSNTDIKDIINTLIDMNSSPTWIYDAPDGREVSMNSIPDAVAKLIMEILIHKKSLTSDSNAKDIVISNYEEYTKNNGIPCPKCGSTAYKIESGCRICIKCGYSPCGGV